MGFLLARIDMDLFLPPLQAPPLSPQERAGIVLAVQSVFMRVRKLHEEVAPIYQRYGFAPTSAGTKARDLSEQIEASIVQHCETFERGKNHADLDRNGEPWEVKIKLGGGLTVNQCTPVIGKTYIVANYHDDATLRAVWVLWHAQDEFFSAKNPLSNARALIERQARGYMQSLFP